MKEEEKKKKKEPHYQPTAPEQQCAGCQDDQDGFTQRLGIKGQNLIICLHRTGAPEAGRERRQGRTREGEKEGTRGREERWDMETEEVKGEEMTERRERKGR